MKELTVSELIINRAKELNITPKLLLISIGHVIDKKSDIDAVRMFIKELCLDMVKAANKQIKGKTKKAGEYALTDISRDEYLESQRIFTGLLSLKNYFDTYPIKHYQLLAWKTTAEEIHGFLKARKNKKGFLANINELCEKEMIALNDMRDLFSNDMISN